MKKKLKKTINQTNGMFLIFLQIQLFVLLAVAVARMEAADAESSRLDHDDSYEHSASQQSRQLIGTYGFGPGGSAYGLDGLSGGPFSAFGGLSGSAPFQPSQLLSIGFDSPAYATGYAGYRPTYGSSYGNQNAYNGNTLNILQFTLFNL